MRVVGEDRVRPGEILGPPARRRANGGADGPEAVVRPG